jgi:hypothetical protein
LKFAELLAAQAELFSPCSFLTLRKIIYEDNKCVVYHENAILFFQTTIVPNPGASFPPQTNSG